MAAAPFPKPHLATFTATVNYSEVVTQGATRAIAKFRAFWDGKARGIELSFQGSNWGDSYPDDPLVFTSRETDLVQYVGVDGTALRIRLPLATESVLRVPWYRVVKLLVKKGYLDPPTGGWASTETKAVGLGHEVKSSVATNSVSASLWFTNFRVESIR